MNLKFKSFQFNRQGGGQFSFNAIPSESGILIVVTTFNFKEINLSFKLTPKDPLFLLTMRIFTGENIIVSELEDYQDETISGTWSFVDLIDSQDVKKTTKSPTSDKMNPVNNVFSHIENWVRKQVVLTK